MSFSGLIDGQSYFYRLKAIDKAGNVGGYASILWKAGPCPANYIYVASHSGGQGLPAFCVAKYEMKQDGNGKAVSQAHGFPWQGLARGSTPTDPSGAWFKCSSLGPGYDLISNKQWQAIARNIENTAANWSSLSAVGVGQLNRGYMNLVTADSGLAATTDDNNGCYNTGASCYGTMGGVWEAKKRTHYLNSGAVIWDFSGNVWEWVKEDFYALSGSTISNGGDWASCSTLTQENKDLFCSSQYFSPSLGVGMTRFNGSIGAPAIIRGGSMIDGLNAGIFAADFTVTQAVAPANTGFRCVYTP